MAHTPPRQDPYHAYHAYHAPFPARRRWLFGTRPPLVRIVRLVRVFSGALPIDLRLRQTLLSLLSLFAHFFAALTNLSSFAVSSQGKGQQLTWIVLPPNGDHNILLSIAHVGHG